MFTVDNIQQENDVTFKVNGQSRQCRVTLVNVSSDNPAACFGDLILNTENVDIAWLQTTIYKQKYGKHNNNEHV